MAGHVHGPTSGNRMWMSLAVTLLFTAVEAVAGWASHSLALLSDAAFIHMAGDAVSSLAVVAAGVIVHFTHWIYADPIVSLLIAMLIAYSAWGIIGEATSILMEGTPKDVDVDALLNEIKSVESVSGVHDLHIWTVGDGIRFLSCHVALPATCTLEQCASIVDAISHTLHENFAIGHATIQTEVEGLCNMRQEADLYCAMEQPQHSHTCDHIH